MRCVIYTRKSADEDPNNQFGSLEAQRELCERYVASQVGEGWELLPDHYDDGGYSGGTLKRPALQRLLDLVDSGGVDIIVVYKIDRLSRSLRDFVNLVERFDRHSVTFVAITQSFSTTNSMGRLTLNVLLSFAQFEREVTGERLRDWFAGARARGMWVHGTAPLGYKAVNRYLAIDETRAECVRFAFERYPKLGSARLIANEMNAKGWLNKYGRPWSKRTVTEMLQNPVYIGKLRHYGEVLPGEHEAIIAERLWHKVQQCISQSARRRAALLRPSVPGMLKGLIVDANGHPMIHVPVHRPSGRVYRYYVPSQRRYGSETCSLHRFQAAPLENAVLALLDRVVGHPQVHLNYHEATGFVRRMIRRVMVGPESMDVTLQTGAMLQTEHAGRLKIMHTPKLKTPDWMPAAITMEKANMSRTAIAKELGLHPSRVYRAFVRLVGPKLGSSQ